MLKKILVCLDGSKFAEGLLPYAIERARRFSSKIVLLKVINLNVSARIIPMPGMSGQSVPIIAQDRLDEMIREEEARDRLYLESVATKLRETGLDADYVARHRIVGDTIGDTIVAHAAENEIDLIMMATHRHGFWKHLVSGSVTESVIRKSSSPILVISPKYDRAKEDAFGKMPQVSST